MPKFQRTLWKPEEVSLLRAIYVNNPKPDSETLSSIAVILKKPTRNIKVWFQNARQRNLILNANDCIRALYLI